MFRVVVGVVRVGVRVVRVGVRVGLGKVHVCFM